MVYISKYYILKMMNESDFKQTQTLQNQTNIHPAQIVENYIFYLANLNIGTIIRVLYINYQFELKQRTSAKMIISQHKRTSYDTDGSIAKVDILRCIRKKQTDPSFIQNHPAIQNQINTSQQFNADEQSKTKSITKFSELMEYFFLTMIVVCCVILIMSFIGVNLNVQIGPDSAKQNTLHKPYDQILKEQQWMDEEFDMNEFGQYELFNKRNKLLANTNNNASSQRPNNSSFSLSSVFSDDKLLTGIYLKLIKQLKAKSFKKDRQFTTKHNSQNRAFAQSNNGIKLVEIKDNLIEVDQKIWQSFVQQLVSKMECYYKRLDDPNDKGKLVCELIEHDNMDIDSTQL